MAHCWVIYGVHWCLNICTKSEAGRLLFEKKNSSMWCFLIWSFTLSIRNRFCKWMLLLFEGWRPLLSQTANIECQISSLCSKNENYGPYLEFCEEDICQKGADVLPIVFRVPLTSTRSLHSGWDIPQFWQTSFIPQLQVRLFVVFKVHKCAGFLD